MVQTARPLYINLFLLEAPRSASFIVQPTLWHSALSWKLDDVEVMSTRAPLAAGDAQAKNHCTDHC